MLGGHAVELSHELLQLAVVAADVLKVVDSLLAPAVLGLNEVEVAVVCEADLGVHLIRYHGGIEIDLAIEHGMDVLG